MATGNDKWYVRSEAGAVYGPATLEALKAWAKDGRIEPAWFVSQDRISWKPAQLLAELEMTWMIEAEPGKFYGPFNREHVKLLEKQGEIPQGANFYRRHMLKIGEDEPPKIVEKVVEKLVEKIVEKPVEKIVEKIVEKPVEVIKEKIVEKIVEKPVEVIKYKEKIVEKPVEVIKEKIVEKIVEVEKPARTELVVPEVIEPVGKAPPVKAPGSIFDGASRDKLAALEAAARRELSRSGKFGFGLFGGRR